MLTEEPTPFQQLNTDIPSGSHGTYTTTNCTAACVTYIPQACTCLSHGEPMSKPVVITEHAAGGRTTGHMCVVPERCCEKADDLTLHERNLGTL